ncbi:MAG: hypothetical protein C4519_19900 [Desulfobacteraceae bacterium]|nr:MAG: hypothetical protein C4519_19900 [Desulfobacteraceae bacterium]
MNIQPPHGPLFPAWCRPALLLLLSLSMLLLLNARAFDIRAKYAAETVSEFGQLPSAALQTLSLEFRGAVSDYLFFKTLTYMGLKLSQRKNPSPDDWRLIHEMLQRVTDLDQRFWDPYLFAEMMLAWQAGMFDEVGALMQKAARYRPEDYRPLFYAGFNQLYFKNDAKAAAPFLREASLRPGAPGYVKGLASRVSLYAGQTGVGIFFLENLIKNTQDPKMAKYLEKRLIALKMIFYLEEKAKEYEARYGHALNSLDDLITSGIVQELPIDPYGGKFVLLNNGRVYTTSKMVDK